MSDFPTCDLRGVPIVDEFPHGCPLSEPVGMAYTALHAIQETGWAKLGQPIQDLSGLVDLSKYEICFSCIGRLAKNPVVRGLRGKKRTPDIMPGVTTLPDPPVPHIAIQRIWKKRRRVTA